MKVTVIGLKLVILISCRNNSLNKKGARKIDENVFDCLFTYIASVKHIIDSISEYINTYT